MQDRFSGSEVVCGDFLVGFVVAVRFDFGDMAYDVDVDRQRISDQRQGSPFLHALSLAAGDKGY
jgi:hypothetical protein